MAGWREHHRVIPLDDADSEIGRVEPARILLGGELVLFDPAKAGHTAEAARLGMNVRDFEERPFPERTAKIVYVRDDGEGGLEKKEVTLGARDVDRIRGMIADPSHPLTRDRIATVDVAVLRGTARDPMLPADPNEEVEL